MRENGVDPYAVLFLRLVLAVALLTFVVLNVGGLDPAAAAVWLGFPSNAPMMFVRAEYLIAMALIFGVWPRAAAVAGAAGLFGAIVSVRGLAVISNTSTFDWTTPAIWIGALFLLALSGDGALALLPTASFAYKEKRP